MGIRGDFSTGGLHLTCKAMDYFIQTTTDRARGNVYRSIARVIKRRTMGINDGMNITCFTYSQKYS